MKLLEMLATLLEIWPETTKYYAQDSLGDIFPYKEKPICVLGFSWHGEIDESKSAPMVVSLNLADDYKTAIITRDMWEAERKPMTKHCESSGNKNGWIRHRGGRIPVAVGLFVDVLCRSGRIHKCVPAGHLVWSHGEDQGALWRIDFVLMVIKIIVPKKELDLLAVADTVDESQVNNPIIWRDRVIEIQKEIFEKTISYELSIKTLDEERLKLIDNLRDEGFVMVDINDAEKSVKNKKPFVKGDRVECLTDRWDGVFTKGNVYIVVNTDPMFIADDLGENSSCEINEDNLKYFKFHSYE